MLLGAGYGTRLRPLTDRHAKAMVPVGDRPLLGHLLSRLRACGAPRIVINVHHCGGDIQRFLRDDPGVGVSVERELLGTAGGIAWAGPLLGSGDVVVWNADILADVDVAGLAVAHACDGADPAATLVVRHRPRREGPVGVDAAGRVVRLRDECVADEASGADFLGVQVLGHRLRARLPRQGCLVRDVYIPALRSGAFLRAFPHASGFFDIGTPRRYLEANLAWLAGRSAAQWAAPGSRIAPGVEVRDAIVGPGASIGGRGVFERSVAWPGARASAPISDAIVVDDQVVFVGS